MKRSLNGLRCSLLRAIMLIMVLFFKLAQYFWFCKDLYYHADIFAEFKCCYIFRLNDRSPTTVNTYVLLFGSQKERKLITSVLILRTSFKKIIKI